MKPYDMEGLCSYEVMKSSNRKLWPACACDKSYPEFKSYKKQYGRQIDPVFRR